MRMLSMILFGTVAACGGTLTGDGVDADGDGDGPGDTGDDGGDDGGDSGGTGDDPGADFGAERECYGIADDLGEVFSIDRTTGQATHLCAVPGDVAEIDAISSHPVTGVYYYVSQSDAELGWLDPDGCQFERLGAIDVPDLAGLSFHPETHVLYAGDQDSEELYRFGQDAGGAPTPEMTLVGSLPATPKALAIEPGTNRAFVSDAEALAVVDLETGDTVSVTPLSTDRVEALFFTVDGSLHGVVDKDGTLANHFVDIDPSTGTVTDVGAMNPVATLPGAADPADADDVEAMECNVGGACTTCSVD